LADAGDADGLDLGLHGRIGFAGAEEDGFFFVACAAVVAGFRHAELGFHDAVNHAVTFGHAFFEEGVSAAVFSGAGSHGIAVGGGAGHLSTGAGSVGRVDGEAAEVDEGLGRGDTAVDFGGGVGEELERDIELALSDDAGGVEIVDAGAGVVQVEVGSDVAAVGIGEGGHESIAEFGFHVARCVAFVVGGDEFVIEGHGGGMAGEPVEGTEGSVRAFDFQERHGFVGGGVVAGAFVFGVVVVGGHGTVRAGAVDDAAVDFDGGGLQVCVGGVDGCDDAGDDVVEMDFVERRAEGCAAAGVPESADACVGVGGGDDGVVAGVEVAVGFLELVDYFELHGVGDGADIDDDDGGAIVGLAGVGDDEGAREESGVDAFGELAFFAEAPHLDAAGGTGDVGHGASHEELGVGRGGEGQGD